MKVRPGLLHGGRITRFISCGNLNSSDRNHPCISRIYCLLWIFMQLWTGGFMALLSTVKLTILSLSQVFPFLFISLNYCIKKSRKQEKVHSRCLFNLKGPAVNSHRDLLFFPKPCLILDINHIINRASFLFQNIFQLNTKKCIQAKCLWSYSIRDDKIREILWFKKEKNQWTTKIEPVV